MDKENKLNFTSYMTVKEYFAVFLYLPIHMSVLPMLLLWMVNRGTISINDAELLRYAIGFSYIISVAFAFLRREFDPLCDRIWRCISEIISCYFLMLFFNYCVSILLLKILPELSNPNNNAIIDLAGTDMRKVKAMTVFLAPMLEEVIFRGGLFSIIRKSNRLAAYAVSMLLFSFYHVYAYAFIDPRYWIFILQYLPVSFLLANCYERTNSVWCCIFFHMLVNGIGLSSLNALQGML